MNLLSDIRFALRLLVKNPGSSAMAILVMAVGTGVAITMFAFVNGVLWSSLGLKQEKEIYRIEWTEPDKIRNRSSIHPLDFDILKSESRSFEVLTGTRGGPPGKSFFNPSGNSMAKQYDITVVESDFFALASEAPLLGRTFRPEDAVDGKEDKIVISYSLWQDQYGSDNSAIGSIAFVNKNPVTVIGVMPPGFHFPTSSDGWIASNWSLGKLEGRRHFDRLNTVGVLKDGVSVDQAKVEFALIAGRIAEEYPETNDNLLQFDFEPYSRYVPFGMGNSFESVCYALLACSLLVLCVASANVFNLIMTRTANRTSELSIRNAMGASRAHVILQVVLDGLVLSLLGTLGGVLIAGWSLKLIWAKFEKQTTLPYWWHMDISPKVVGFVVLVIIVSGIASSLIPGLRASRTSVAENLKDDSRTSSSLFVGTLSKCILGFQVTITGILTFVSVVMLLVWVHLKNRDLPYEPSRILSASIRGVAETEDVSITINFMKGLAERMESHSGVQAIAYSRSSGGGLAGGRHVVRNFEVEGESYASGETRPQAAMHAISEGYAEVYGVEPLLGRKLSYLDTFDSELVCMVNKMLADQYWPNENPIGKRIRVIGFAPGGSEYRTIVGVLPNLLPKPLPGENPVQEGYLKVMVPFTQTGTAGTVTAMLRVDGDALQYVEPLRRALKEVDPQLAFNGEVTTIQGILDRYMITKELVFGMFGLFGVASLVLGVVGLYAVMSFATRQRFREFGIRMAMGANSSEIVSSVVSRGLFLLISGGLLGLSVGHAVSLVLRTSMGVHELPFGYAYPIVGAVLILGMAFSLGIPAWRASRISPTQALRVE